MEVEDILLISLSLPFPFYLRKRWDPLFLFLEHS